MVIVILLSNSFGQDRPDHFELLSKHFHVAKPKGNGPFPAVMLVPGCTGFNWDFMKTQYDRTQNLLVESGFYTIRVDYLAVRNIPSCMMGVSPEDVANDIGAVVNYLRHLNVVKKHTLNFIGWSFGGAGALKLLKDYNSPGAAKIDAVIAYYPPCVYVQSWNSEVPALILIGANDNAAPPINCKSLFNGLPNPEKVTIRIYDDAYHCFDNRDLPPEMKIGLLGTVGYNEAAAKSAWKEVTDFLKR